MRGGGVMRCCFDTVARYEGPQEEGMVLPCDYSDKHTLVHRDGAWEWNRHDELEI